MSQSVYEQFSPVTEGIERPFWSVAISTYNRTAHLADTLRSVLQQDPGPQDMQIEVLDNCSTEGDAEEITRSVGGGRVTFVRNERNLGPGGNWNEGIRRARGRWVHILHDDDMVLPGFYETMRRAVEPRPWLGAAFCPYALIDDKNQVVGSMTPERPTAGVLEDWLETICTRCACHFVGLVVQRSAYEAVGGFSDELAASAVDWDMWKRLGTRFAFWHEPGILALYRSHEASDTSSRVLRTALNISDGRKSIELTRKILPAEIRDKLTQMALELYALAALKGAVDFVNTGRIEFAVNQAWEGLKTSDSAAVLEHYRKVLSEPLAGPLVTALLERAGKCGAEEGATLATERLRSLVNWVGP